MKGRIEAISYKNYGVKIDNSWYNAKSDEIRKILSELNKGDWVEYSAQDKTLLSIRKVVVEEQRAEFKTADKLDQSYEEILQGSLLTIKQMIRNMWKPEQNEVLPSLDWTKIIIVLFMEKTKRLQKVGQVERQ